MRAQGGEPHHTDSNFVYPVWIVTELPRLVGLILAGIFARPFPAWIQSWQLFPRPPYPFFMIRIKRRETMTSGFRVFCLVGNLPSAFAGTDSVR